MENRIGLAGQPYFNPINTRISDKEHLKSFDRCPLRLQYINLIEAIKSSGRSKVSLNKCHRCVRSMESYAFRRSTNRI